MAAFEEKSEVDQIILDPTTGSVAWRISHIVLKDGVEFSRRYERSSAEVGDVHPNEPAEVAPFRAMVDTPQNRQKKAKRKADLEAIIKK